MTDTTLADFTSLVPLFQKLRPMTDLDYDHGWAGAGPVSFIAEHDNHILIIDQEGMFLHYLDENGEIEAWENILTGDGTL